MTQTRSLKTAGIITAFAAVILAGMMYSSKRVRARDDERNDQSEESRIQRGFEIAPVPLNLQRKNRALVGLGSYIVNAVGDCNGCHSAGPPSEFTSDGNPYQLSPPFSGIKQINAATYLGGGRDFGPYGAPPQIPHLYSRNLTPDKTGIPCRRPLIRGVRRDHEAWHRLRSRTSKLHSSRHSCQLPRSTLQRRGAPGHALALFQGHDRP